MFQLLSPLLDTPGLLQGCGFAFKFFLPLQLQQPMLEHQIGRLDRIPQRVLSWNRRQLVTMLSQRLSSYSRISETSSISTVNSFRELCDVDFDPDELLAHAAQSSPRRLLDLGRAILEVHCERVDGIDTQITADTIQDVLNRATYAKPTVPAPTIPAVSAAVSEEPPDLSLSTSHIPPLFIDTRGDIWLGHHHRQDIKLSKLLRICMDYLWQNRDRVVRHEELFEVLYGDDLSQRADPGGSCDKLIQRLRKALEPDQHGSSYIETQPGVGYVLRNYRDECTETEEDISHISLKNP
jgi:DNA-binding winged helix-turn-helix (wHTH) protein